jgi:predicted esterase
MGRFLLTALLLGSAGSAATAAALPAGWTRLELPPPASSYALAYVPAALVEGGPAPAVVFLHGAGATPEQWRPLLAPLAEQLGFVLVLPRAGSAMGFGVGPDDAIVAAALRQAGAGGRVDPRRVGLAGHSAGGAYAIELAYSTPSSFSGVFALASPYRTVVRLAGPGAPPPLRLYYGTTDPNYGSALAPLGTMLTRLGVPWHLDLGDGYGHNTWPQTTLAEGLAFLLGQPVPGCVPEPAALCLGGGRFRVDAAWETAAGAGAAGAAQTTAEAGTFWFFTPSNLELDVKVLDGCGVNGKWWVFAAGLTNVGVALTVTDTQTGEQRRYVSDRGTAFQPIQDTSAFAGCP